MALRPRAVIVWRKSELTVLLEHHGTIQQAEFFLRSRGRNLAEVRQSHEAVQRAKDYVLSQIPASWAVAEVERSDLSRFITEDEDVIVVVGQDGLVANVAKYLHGQLVIGINPEPEVIAGVLVRHTPWDGMRLALNPTEVEVRGLTMVQASFDDGQRLIALNEVFIGQASHQSARYDLHTSDSWEHQSSSGIITGTGTGATGWLASLAHDRGGRQLPESDRDELAWFVREAWPSPSTGVQLTEGLLREDAELRVVVKSDELVVFGDGIESDRLIARYGQEIRLRVAEDRLRLAVDSRGRN